MLIRQMTSNQGDSPSREIQNSVSRWTGLVCLIALTVASDGTAADPAKAGTKSARWEVTADPGTQVKWPDKLTTNIAQPTQHEEILFPSTPSEFCLVGLKPYESDRAELWNLAEGKRVGTMKGTPVQANRRALSPDGKYLAVAALDRKTINSVEVWSLETGKRVCSFIADAPEMPMTILDFAGADEVLTYTFGSQNGRNISHLRVWDAKDGSPLRQMDLEKGLSGDGRYDISPGRNFIASIVIPEILIYDLQTGRIKGAVPPPVRMEDGKSISVDSVRFSPDGTEIACMSEGFGGAVIAVHDMATGDLKFSHEMTAAQKSSLQHPASYKGPYLEFVTAPPGFSGMVARSSNATRD